MPRYKMMKKDSQTQRVIRWCCKSSEDRTKITWSTKIHLVLMGFMVSLCEWDAIFGSNITHYLITLKSFFVKSTPLTNGSTPVAAIFAVYTGSGFGTLLILCFIKWKFQRESEEKAVTNKIVRMYSQSAQGNVFVPDPIDLIKNTKILCISSSSCWQLDTGAMNISRNTLLQ